MFAVTFTIPDFVLGLIIGSLATILSMLIIALLYGKRKDA